MTAPSSINIYVKRLGTGEIVDTIKVANPTSRKVEKVMRGLLMNMDTDEYYADDSEADDLD